jgi:hypothetical protein
LNKIIFQMSPHRWTRPTKRSTMGSGTNKAMTGTIIVDVPNPVAVPIPEATSVNSKAIVQVSCRPFLVQIDFENGAHAA